MPTNQDIWGQEADWYNPNNYQTGTKKENKVLCGSFGTAPTGYEQGSLGNGLYHDILPHTSYAIQEKIDESISYCGLGNESVWSRIKYSLANKDTFGTFDKEDNRTVTNFSIPYKLSEKNGLWQTNMTSGGSSAGQTTSGNRCRWSPQGFDNFDFTSTTSATNANANFNRTVTPYVSIPVRNFILFPVLRVASGMNENEGSTGYSGTQTVSLQKYIDLQNTVNYNTHPYIIGVSAQPYAFMYDVEDIDEVTGEGIGDNANRDRTTLTNLMPNGLMVLSPLSYAMDAPVDVSNPTESLQEVYNYSCFKSSSTLLGIPIFGVYDNRSSITPSMGQISMSANPTLQMLWFLPHENAVYREKNNGTSGRYGYYYLEYYDNGPDDNFVDWVRQQIACFGLFFTEDEATVKRGALNDPLMMLGVLDSNGVGHGQWVAGTDNESQSQWEWDTTNKSSYKPSGGGGGEDDPYGDNTKHITAGSGVNVGGKWYVDDNLSTWNGLLSWCSQIPLEGSSAVDKSLFFGQNPIDCIIEAKYIFVNDYTFGKSVQPRGPISLGSYTDSGGVNAYPFTTSYPKTFNCGYVDIKKPFGDFRDLSPFTTITLLLPFAGSIDLPTEIFMGHRCNLKETIDPLSGDLIYYVSVDNIDYCKVNGNCAMDLSINGLETATLAQTKYRLQTQENVSYFNAMASLVGGLSGASISASSGNIVGLLSQFTGGVVNYANAEYQAKRAHDEMERSAAPPAKISKSSSNVEWGDSLFPQIVIATAKMIEGYSDESYKNKTGFATYKVAKIGEQSGPVVCRNVVLDSLGCTSEEKQMIKQLLESGIYIK